MKVKLLIDIQPPAPGKNSYPIPDREKSVEEEVRNAIDCIESGHDSHVEWRLLNKLYNELKGRKDKRAKQLMGMIEPTLAKYGVYGVPEGEPKK